MVATIKEAGAKEAGRHEGSAKVAVAAALLPLLLVAGVLLVVLG